MKLIFQSKNFFFYVFLGLIHALLIFVLVNSTTRENFIINENGYSVDFWMKSVNEFSIIVIVLLNNSRWRT